MKKFGFGLLILFWGFLAFMATMAGYGQAVGIVFVGVFMVLVIGLLNRIARGIEALKPSQ